MNFRLVQQALAALEMYREHTPEGNGVAEQAIEALKQFKKEWVETEVPYVVVECNCSGKTTIYSPPQRTWVGLTLEDMETIHWSPDFRAGAKWAAAKLKDKNT